MISFLRSEFYTCASYRHEVSQCEGPGQVSVIRAMRNDVARGRVWKDSVTVCSWKNIAIFSSKQYWGTEEPIKFFEVTEKWLNPITITFRKKAIGDLGELCLNNQNQMESWNLSILIFIVSGSTVTEKYEAHPTEANCSNIPQARQNYL